MSAGLTPRFDNSDTTVARNSPTSASSAVIRAESFDCARTNAASVLLFLTRVGSSSPGICASSMRCLQLGQLSGSLIGAFASILTSELQPGHSFLIHSIAMRALLCDSGQPSNLGV
jgi:hypothetical protein